MIPRLCEEILKCKEEWIPQAQQVAAESNENLLQTASSSSRINKSKRQPYKHSRPEPSSSGGLLSPVDEDESSSVCPVIRYSSFEERVRRIDPLATSDFIRIAGNYLQDMGEVSYFFVSYVIAVCMPSDTNWKYI